MTDLTALTEAVAKMTPTNGTVRLRDERDGQERYDVLGSPCGIPIATFGDVNDAYGYLALKNAALHLIARIEAGGERAHADFLATVAHDSGFRAGEAHATAQIVAYLLRYATGRDSNSEHVMRVARVFVDAIEAGAHKGGDDVAAD